ncbi:hypothetical protein CRUP_011716 [Coryphaenoides rupestris]|nr:hypothetical protein CRUP_011716 [Coryphaenoides rupestris]
MSASDHVRSNSAILKKEQQHPDSPRGPISKKIDVQLCIVGCTKTQTHIPAKSEPRRPQTKRSSFQDSYKKTEIWSLQELSLIDGRDPDVVSH